MVFALLATMMVPFEVLILPIFLFVRITSYNVCYTKLLRTVLKEPADSVAQARGQAGLEHQHQREHQASDTDDASEGLAVSYNFV